jgi:hypothetical protein
VPVQRLALSVARGPVISRDEVGGVGAVNTFRVFPGRFASFRVVSRREAD